ncbi:MAG: hypothetical protein HY875_11475 [Chloroflexi bacterium]|nr:hypothetical protein [Chloroflexota bacterium]
MKSQQLPKGWDEDRVRAVAAHYETQTEDEELAEFEAAWAERGSTMMEVPKELVPAVRRLIASHQAGAR